MYEFICASYHDVDEKFGLTVRQARQLKKTSWRGRGSSSQAQSAMLRDEAEGWWMAGAVNTIGQSKRGGGDRSSRPAQLQARENEQKALSLWIKARPSSR
jgi:hypothetical protein